MAVIKLENPLGHVVEEIPVMSDQDDGSMVAAQDGLPAKRQSRHQGGLWARRVGAGLAFQATVGRARLDVVHHHSDG